MIESISLDQLKATPGHFEGYYWLSNANQPKVCWAGKPLSETELITQLETALPFVIEAGFWEKETRVSLAIKQVDDRLIITRVDLKAAEHDPAYAIIERKHLSILKEDPPRDPEQPRRHPMRLYELWRETPGGPNLADFPVLTPSLTVFGGFLSLT